MCMAPKWKIGCGDRPSYIVAVVISVSHQGQKERRMEFPIHALVGNVALLSLDL